MASPATAVLLTSEFRERALGIDTRFPRFSWKMNDARPGALQTGYRLQVAADAAFSEPSLLWNAEASGSDSVLVPYEGEPLASRSRYFVRVAICDHKNEWSDWSEPSWFETAFLDDEWVALWIAGGEEEVSSERATPGEQHPARYLRREFVVPGHASDGAPGSTASSSKTAPATATPGARLYVAARGLVELYLNGRRVGADVLSPGWTDFSRRCQYLTYDVSDYLVPGTNVIGAILGDGWYSGRIARLQDGPRVFGSTPQLLLELHSAGSQSVAAQPAEGSDSAPDSEVVARDKTATGSATDGPAETLLVASDAEWQWTTGPIVRSDIYDGEVYDARLELPGWAGGAGASGENARGDVNTAESENAGPGGNAAQSAQAAQSETAPQSETARPGGNAPRSAQAAQSETAPKSETPGADNPRAPWTPVRVVGPAYAPWYGAPARGTTHDETSNTQPETNRGTTHDETSNTQPETNERTTHDATNNTQPETNQKKHDETSNTQPETNERTTHDATTAPGTTHNETNQKKHNETNLSQLATNQGTNPTLDAKVVPPPRRVKELTPVNITTPAPGTFIYDLGQNISGWARLTVSGKAGQTATLRFGEMLQADGTLYTENLRSAIATDQYIFAADGTVSWEPTFTFHGFRYVELTGLDIDPDPSQITGIVVHNDLEKTGSFSCSNELLNQLQSNIEWGQRGNYLEAPTDCPQRDERLGWTGDAQVFIPTASFVMNVAPFFEKWQRDLADSQGSAGTIPSVAPAIRYMTRETENDGGPAWSDAVVICPWTLYTRYGDTRVLEEHYESMRAFIESMERRSRGLIRSDEFVVANGGYGDWVSMDAPEGERVGATPKDLIGTAYFAYSTDLMRRIAALLGKRDDELVLRDLHRRIVQAFRAEYVTAAGRVLGDTQTSYVVALAFDLLPEELRQPAVDRLVSKLERRGYRMTTGFVGTPLLCPVLTRFGRADVAYRLLQQEQFPSWLYTVKQGATTMWERWNSFTLEHGFGPVEMNSFNHYAYGSIGDWMYRSVAGLEVTFADRARGEAALRIAPNPGYGLTQAQAQLETPFGTAKSGWRIEDGRVELSITVPANSWAHVEIPAGTAEVEIDADEGEEELEALVIHEETVGGVFHFRVAAGSYAFAWDCEAVVLPST